MDDEFVFTLTTNASVVSASYQEYESSEKRAIIGLQETDLKMVDMYRQSTRAFRSMDRAIMMGMSGAAQLGLMFPQMHGVMGALQKGAYAMSMAYATYNLYRGIIAAKVAWKEIEAAAETVAAAVAQNWWAIASAGVAAGIVYEAFKQPSNLHFDIDWGTSQGRRQMAGEIAGAGG
jgi:hypothetical protein